ncbi:g274 [Coccomyxa elongata]
MNVGYVLGEEQLNRYFSHFGNVLDVYLPKHKSGRNKGFGFTTFETEEELERVLQTPEHVVEGVLVKINKAGPRPEYEQTPRDDTQAPKQAGSDTSNGGNHQTLGGSGPGGGSITSSGAHGRGPRLYVGGVPDEITEEDIIEHFNKWGNVVDVYFPGKKGAKRVNYCFVTYDNWRSAQRACNQSERNIDGKPLQSISMAEERQGEARSDDGGLSSLTASLSPSLSIPLNPATIAAMNLAARSGLASYNPLGNLQTAPTLGGLQSSVNLNTLQGLLASGIPPSTLQALLSGLAAGSGDFAAASPTASGLDTRTLAGLLASGAFGAQNIPTTPPKIPLTNPFASLQQPSAMASSLLGGPTLSSPAGALPARTSQDFAGMGSLTDPMAAVYANVNQNLSPTGASLLTPWGMQPGQQVHAPEGHQPNSPTVASDMGNYPIGNERVIPNTANVQQYAALLAAQAQMKAQASKQTSIDHLGSQPSEFMTQSSPQDPAAMEGRLQSGDLSTSVGAGGTLDGMYGSRNVVDDLRTMEDNMRLAEGQLHDLTL